MDGKTEDAMEAMPLIDASVAERDIDYTRAVLLFLIPAVRNVQDLQTPRVISAVAWRFIVWV